MDISFEGSAKLRLFKPRWRDRIHPNTIESSVLDAYHPSARLAATLFLRNFLPTEKKMKTCSPMSNS